MAQKNKESIPSFKSLEKALESGGPFRLTSNAKYSLDKVPQDKRGFFHDALLMLDQITWKITNEEELQFITNVIKEHQRIDMLDLFINTDIDTTQLAVAIQSCKISRIELRRSPQKSIGDLTPILLALQKITCLKRFKLTDGLDPIGDYNALACAIQNEQLEEVVIFKPVLVGDFWTSLTPVFSAHTSLKSLELAWGYKWQDGLEALVEFISKNSSIQQLTIRNITAITAIDAKMLCDALKSNFTLKSLLISFFDKDGTVALFEALAHNQVKLSKLKLSRVKIDYNTLKVLNESLSTNTLLTSLELKECNLSNDTCQTLCHALKSNKSIKRLNLSSNAFGVAGMTAVCELVNSNGLEVLQLTASGVRSPTYDKHLNEIAQMLRNNKSLTKLDVSHNLVTDRGLNDIYEAMVHNTTLKKLMLEPLHGKNCLTDKLTVMLACNKTLRHLQVTVDTMTEEESYDLLCNGLAQNDSLTHLEIVLVENLFMKASHGSLAKRIAEVLSNNYTLTTISIDRRTCHQIDPLLQRNRQLKSDIRFLVAILSHNIARSSHALTILPREIWKKILSLITSPGMEPFDDLVEMTFKSY